MEEMMKTLPQHKMKWLKERLTLYKYQNFWNFEEFHKRGILVQQRFKAQPSDILLCSCPKSGTTWLKALAFAIVTRQKFDDESSSSSSPLLTTFPHTCVPFLESGLHQIQDNQKNSSFPLMATHLPYASLPESVVTSNCKIVYIYRNFKDVIVSHYHFLREIVKLPLEDAPFEEAFEDFCEGVSGNGPYWDHILGYWNASQERPNIVLLLKYEDMKKDPANNVKKLAEFIGYPFTIEEMKTGEVERIINLCSFDNLSNLEVNKSGIDHIENLPVVENRLYFRLAKDGDWKNYFTNEMEEKIDKLMDVKFSGTGLLLK